MLVMIFFLFCYFIGQWVKQFLPMKLNDALLQNCGAKSTCFINFVFKRKRHLNKLSTILTILEWIQSSRQHWLQFFCANCNFQLQLQSWYHQVKGMLCSEIIGMNNEFWKSIRRLLQALLLFRAKNCFQIAVTLKEKNSKPSRLKVSRSI